MIPAARCAVVPRDCGSGILCDDTSRGLISGGLYDRVVRGVHCPPPDYGFAEQRRVYRRGRAGGMLGAVCASQRRGRAIDVRTTLGVPRGSHSNVPRLRHSRAERHVITR